MTVPSLMTKVGVVSTLRRVGTTVTGLNDNPMMRSMRSGDDGGRSWMWSGDDDDERRR